MQNSWQPTTFIGLLVMSLSFFPIGVFIHELSSGIGNGFYLFTGIIVFILFVGAFIIRQANWLRYLILISIVGMALFGTYLFIEEVVLGQFVRRTNPQFYRLFVSLLIALSGYCLLGGLFAFFTNEKIVRGFIYKKEDEFDF